MKTNPLGFLRFAVLQLVFLMLIALAVEAKPRVIVTTDAEVDDRCSMVRFLLYANEFDIEGLVISSSQYHWAGHRWSGDEWLYRQIDMYGQVHSNLLLHDSSYPTPDALRKLVYVGNIDAEGEMEKVTPGSQRIVEVLLSEKKGLIYLQAWGGTNTIARALKTIQEEHPERMEDVSKKARLFLIQDQDNTYRDYIQPNWPKLQTIISRQFVVIAYTWDKALPKQFLPLYEAKWMKENILENHGPLCASYEVRDDGAFRSEGDSPAFLHNIPNGLAGSFEPYYGGWGGRFKLEEGSENTWVDAEDDQNRGKPLWRWAGDFQNDFGARADWCVKPYDQANHAPEQTPKESVTFGFIRPGETKELEVLGISDPDGDELSYHWWVYDGPSGDTKGIIIKDADKKKATIVFPKDLQKGKTEYHLMVTVRDNGSPSLCAYKRYILKKPE